MQYLIVKARNTVTNETVKNQDLNGHRYTMNQRTQAQAAADQLAHKMTARTHHAWQGFVEAYVPSQRRTD